ncbi:hypothetical protein ACM42_05570 [Bradyrhizobium sp. CCBAU 25338]|nr:hypothetical protein [Bradyrhizobium sp. CCBAU 25338]
MDGGRQRTKKVVKLECLKLRVVSLMAPRVGIDGRCVGRTPRARIPRVAMLYPALHDTLAEIEPRKLGLYIAIPSLVRTQLAQITEQGAAVQKLYLMDDIDPVNA